MLIGLKWARGEGTQLFFGGYVPRGFPIVGFWEHVFLEKMRGHASKIENFASCSAILAKNKAENAKFFYKLKIGRLGSADWPEKRGS